MERSPNNGQNLATSCKLDMVEEWQERAAIREFDGGMDRQIAEKYAAKDIEKMYGFVPETVREAMGRGRDKQS